MWDLRPFRVQNLYARQSGQMGVNVKIKYRFNNEYSVEDVIFDGLNGREYVTSTKDALNVMKIENPAVDFTEDVKAGHYDDLTDEEYQQALDMIKCISKLWRCPGEPEETASRYDMNILSLLANAIEMIGRQDVQLRRYRKRVQ